MIPNKRELLDSLRKAHQGENSRRFDAETAWRNIERAAQYCDAGQRAVTLHSTPGERRKYFDTLKKDVRRVETKLNRIKKDLQLEADFRWASQQKNTDKFSIEDLFATVSELEGLAHTAANRQPRGKKGKREGRSPFPEHSVEVLGTVYEISTGRKPTSTFSGPFVQFAALCLEAFGYKPTSDERDLAHAMSKAVKEFKRRPAH